MITRVRENRDLMTSQHNFDNAVLYLSQIISQYEQRQDEIIDVITNTRRNMVSHTLFTPAQVESQMEMIKRHVGNQYTVPKELDIYSIGKVLHYKVNQQYIFKLTNQWGGYFEHSTGLYHKKQSFPNQHEKILI